MTIEKIDELYRAIVFVDGTCFTGFGTSHIEAMEECFSKMINSDNWVSHA